MKKTIRVIDHKNLPTKLPLNLTLIILLILDRTQPSNIIKAVMCGLIVSLWISAFFVIRREKRVDLLAYGDDKES